jgi:hypothetical protein
MTSQFGAAAAASYQPFNETEKAAARVALAQWAEASGVTFIEVSHAEQADIRFGFFDFNLSQHGGDGGIGFFPYVPFYVSGSEIWPQSEEYWAAQGTDFSLGGDTFYNSNFRAGWDPKWFMLTLLHEVGHALGIKHPHEAGGEMDAVLASHIDSDLNTVMSYVHVPGADIERLGYLDVQAAQYLYGGPESDGTQFFSWSYDPSTETVFITAGGANDRIRGTGTHDVINAGAGDDVVYAASGNDWIIGGSGLDYISGGLGLDTYVTGLSPDQMDQLIYGGLLFSSLQTPSGSEWITDVERFVFGNKTLAFDIEGNAGQAYRIYQAAFDRTPDEEGLGYWISALDKGFGLIDAAASFIHSKEFKDTYGSPETVSNQQFITLLYANVLDRAPDQGGLQYWLTAMNSGFSRDAMLASFSESPENKQNVIGAIEDGVEYLAWLA